jgi:glycosyltransferase involved in cell wall biosynthesis
VRILHIVDGIPPLTLGGTGRIVTEVARGQQRTGHEVWILSAPINTLPPSMDGVKLLTVPPLMERYAHWRAVFSNRREKEVLAQIDRVRPDIVHAHTISRQMGYRFMLGIKKRGIKLIITCHDVSHVAYGKVLGTERYLWWTEIRRHRWNWNPWRHTGIRHFLRSADAILTVSDALKLYLQKRGLGPAQGIVELKTIHNGLDEQFWKEEKSMKEARELMGLPRDAFLFLLAGRMGYDKGSTLIAHTLPTNAHLILAGEGSMQEFTEVKDRMTVLLNQSPEQMRLLFMACNAVLVPSRCLDCFPTVCIEAMAMGRPVLATSWGGAKESVQDDVTGKIIDPMNESAWVETMQWCMDHGAELDIMGRNGRERFLQYFTLQTMLEKLEEVYRA